MPPENNIDGSKTEDTRMTRKPACVNNTTSLLRYLNGICAAVLGCMVLIISIMVYVPLTPSLPYAGLDSGWAFALNQAVDQGLVFGRDIIFTFGPYASVYTSQFNPATNTIMLIGCALMAAAFGSILLCICAGYARLFAVALVLLLLLETRDTQFFALPFVALILIYRVSLPHTSPASIVTSPGVKFTLGLSLLALGMQPLVKGTFGICSVIVVFSACILLYRRRRFALAFCLSAGFVGWLAILWVAVGQPLGSMFSCFLNQLPVITGYSAAMSVYGPRWQIDWFLIGATVIWVVGNRRFRDDGDAGLALAIGSALILYLSFKEGFVRDDGHSLIAGGMLGVSGLAFALFRKTPSAAVCCAIGLATFFVVNESQFGLTQRSFVHLTVGSMAETIAVDLRAQFEQAASSIESRIKNPRAMEVGYDAGLAAIRNANVLPALSGPTDIYSFGQSVLFANGLQWDPRPVMQSYSAYTPALLLKNAGHLIGPRAPANILFAVQPIDGRLPSLEDGASWPALLENYVLTGIYDDLLLLQRRSPHTVIPRGAYSKIMTGTYRLGEMIPIPADTQTIWSQIDVQPTILGRVVGLIFKPPSLNILYVFPDGYRKEFRFIAGMGQTEFLLSPLVQSTQDFAALAMPNSKRYFSGQRPSSIRLTANYGGGLLWRSQFSLQLLSAEIPAQTGIEQLFVAALRDSVPATYPVTSSCSIDQINGRAITDLPVKVEGFIKAVGWAAVSAKSGLAATQTLITLTSADGSQQSAIATPVARTDIAKFFNQPALEDVGFNLTADPGTMSGARTLGVEVIRGGQTYSCDRSVPIDILPPAVAAIANLRPN